MPVQRESFIFYRSFFDAAILLKPKDRVDFILAVCDYALNGVQREMSPNAEAVFLIARKSLDASLRNYDNGKKGGRPKKPAENPVSENPETTKTKTKTITKTETMTKDDDEDRHGFSSSIVVVEDAYREKINPLPSQICLDELAGYVLEMGPDCCLRAIDAALDAGKPSWSYIRGVLRNKKAQGARSLADWDELEAGRREASRKAPPPGQGRQSWAELAREMDREEGLA